MTIKSSGGNPPTNPLSFTEISNEFGLPPNKNLGAYRVDTNIGSLSELALDSGIPQSGQIKFSDFYSKKLNIVVKCTGGNRATVPYGNNAVVVGGFKNKPSRNASAWQGGKKIFINVTGTYSSNDASSSEFALKTGNSSVWPSGTDMVIDLGSNSKIVGRGGNGGNASGGDGGNGSNALRYLSGATLNFNKDVATQSNGAYISAGGGGGGGGSRAEQNDWGDRNDAEGGGGGGGNGLPAGSGGDGNGGGNDGELTNGGGGKDGESDSEAQGGNGGKGGSNGGDGNNAGGGSNKKEENGDGGEGGKATEAY